MFYKQEIDIVVKNGGSGEEKKTNGELDNNTTPAPATKDKPEETLHSVLTGSFKENIIVATALSILVSILIICYYNIQPVNDFFINVAKIKGKYGFLFSAISSGICGGLIPQLLVLATTSSADAKPVSYSVKHVSFFVALLIYNGIEGK